MIRLGLQDHRTNFRPGEIIQGAALWESAKAPKRAEVRLLWFTQGKGTTDTETVASEEFPNPLPGDTRTFTFTVPDAPYSFSGRLISLIWAVELVLEDEDQFQRLSITVTPDGQEVSIPAIIKPDLPGLPVSR